MKVKLAEKAQCDLLEIGDDIARDDPSRAIAFVGTLQVKCLAIGELPHGFPLVRGRENHHVRRRMHGRYAILYRVDDDAVVILHVVHGARDYDGLL